MKIYAVGGMVRDKFLGHEAIDHDYVVVGARPEDLVARGYTPVGRDFPVFLDTLNNATYALARCEKKVAPGHQGFRFYATPDITLEQDLLRRDLTINAMAQDVEGGTIIDPCHGQADLQAKVLRHVSPAFVEDPLRVLRVARFAARLPDFVVAPETMALMQQIVKQGDLQALSPERVWGECARGFLENMPSRMLDILAECGALENLVPYLAKGWHTLNTSDKKRWDDLPANLCIESIKADVRISAQCNLLVVLCYGQEGGTAMEQKFLGDFASWHLPLIVMHNARQALKFCSRNATPLDQMDAATLLYCLQSTQGLTSADTWDSLLYCWNQLKPIDLDFWRQARVVAKAVTFPADRLHDTLPVERSAIMQNLRTAALAQFLAVSG